MYQNKVNSSLAVSQRPGHFANNCKMVYSGQSAKIAENKGEWPGEEMEVTSTPLELFMPQELPLLMQKRQPGMTKMKKL